MKDRTRNSWLGVMVGLGAGQVILAIIFEYYLLMELLLIWPLLIPLFSAVVGLFLYRKLGSKAPSVLISVFIFWLLIGISLLLPNAWSFWTQKQHEKYMEIEVPNFPSAVILEQRYAAGDGFDNGPGLVKKFRSSDDMKAIEAFYKQTLSSNGWDLETSLGAAWFTKRTPKHYWGLEIVPTREDINLTEYELVFSIYN